MKKTPKSRLRYKTEEAWENAQESKRRYCRRYRKEHAQEILAKERDKRAEAAKIRETRKDRFAAVKEEFGIVVSKLRHGLGMTEREIYELLGGLVTLKDVAALCKLKQLKPRNLVSRKPKRK